MTATHTPQPAFLPLLQRFIDWFMPQRCALCNAVSTAGFCPPCQPLLPWIATACARCGASLESAGICGRCQKRPPSYHDSRIPFHYQAPISNGIQRFKYGADLNYAGTFADMLTLHLLRAGPPWPEVLIPVPLHPRRLRQRGFNQALELAAMVGKKLRIPVISNRLHRQRNTPAQVGLNAAARRKNMHQAFIANDVSQFTHIALIDDIVTTGSTANAAAAALRTAGAGHITVWAVAKPRFT